MSAVTSDRMMAEPVSEIGVTLEGVRRRLRTSLAVQGVAWFTAMLLAGGAIVAVVDAVVELPPLVRAVLAGMAVVAAGLAAWWNGWRALGDVSTLMAARWLEMRSPELGERVSTCISAPQSAASATMRLLLAEETARLFRATRPIGWFPGWRLATLIMIAATGIAVVTLANVWGRSGIERQLVRLVSPWSNSGWGVAGDVRSASGDLIVAKGTPFEVAADYRAWPWSPKLPSSIQLMGRDSDGDAIHAVLAADPESPGRFLGTVPGLRRDARFRLVAPGAASPWQHIEVGDPPELTRLTWIVDPPAYTGLPAQRLTSPAGEIEVAAGSRLSMELAWNLPVASGKVEWMEVDSQASGGTRKSANEEWVEARVNEEALAPKPVDETNLGAADSEAKPRDPQAAPAAAKIRPLELATDGRSGRFSLEVERDARVAYHWSNARGLPGRTSDGSLSVVAKPDLPPEVHLAGDVPAGAVSPDETIEFTWNASDDYGLSQATLELEIEGRGKEQRPLTLSDDDGRTAAGRVSVALADLRLKTGDRATFQFVAVDNRERPGPQQSKSDPISIAIDESAQSMAERELAQWVDERQAEVADFQQKLAAAEQDLRQQHAAANDAARKQKDLDQQAALAKERADLDELRRMNDAIADKLAERSLFADAAESLRENAGQERLNAASEDVERAQAAEARDRLEPLGEAVDELAAARREANDVAAELERLEQLAKQLAQLDRLGDRAEQLAKAAESIADQAKSLPPDQPNAMEGNAGPSSANPSNESNAQNRPNDRNASAPGEPQTNGPSEEDVARLRREQDELMTSLDKTLKQNSELARLAEAGAREQLRGAKESVEQLANLQRELAKQIAGDATTSPDAKVVTPRDAANAPQTANTPDQDATAQGKEPAAASNADPQSAPRDGGEQGAPMGATRDGNSPAMNGEGPAAGDSTPNLKQAVERAQQLANSAEQAAARENASEDARELAKAARNAATTAEAGLLDQAQAAARDAAAMAEQMTQPPAPVASTIREPQATPATNETPISNDGTPPADNARPANDPAAPSGSGKGRANRESAKNSAPGDAAPSPMPAGDNSASQPSAGKPASTPNENGPANQDSVGEPRGEAASDSPGASKPTPSNSEMPNERSDSAEGSSREPSFAEQERALSNELGKLAESRSSRRDGAQQGQRAMAERSGELSRRLARLSEQLPQGQPSQGTNQASEQSRAASDQGRQAAEAISAGRTEQAAQRANDAADALDAAVKSTTQALGAQPASTQTGTTKKQGSPGQMASKLAQARERLQESREAAECASGQCNNPSGQHGGKPGAGQSSGGSGKSQPRSDGPQPVAGNSPSPGGEPSRLDAPPPANEGFQQAADGLHDAAKSLKELAGRTRGRMEALGKAGEGQATPQAPTAATDSGNQLAENSSSGANASGATPGGGVGGNVHAILPDLAASSSVRSWGRRDKRAASDVQDHAARKPPADYARPIKLYFEELSRSKPVGSPY